MAPLKPIESLILVIRGQRVMLDADLAILYGVPTRVLNQAVKRNLDRFPPEFMFKITLDQAKSLRSQFVTSNAGRGGRRYSPYAFTEHGAIMAANVLNSPRAIQASVHVVRAFVKLREMLGTHKELAHKFAQLERRLDSHDESIQVLLAAIRQLMDPKQPPRRRIGFHQGGGK
ncbi:MAG: DNA-binding protein [Deltaproteobacteria bacterium RBG_13_61_14]|nr:MAG: DNA-binding protein [Deltaproteobacteria bacterium RBG_13_61_14]